MQSSTDLVLVIAFSTNMAEQTEGTNPIEAPDDRSFASNAIAELSGSGIPFGMFAVVATHMTVAVLLIVVSSFGIAVLRFSFWRPALLYVYSVLGLLTTFTFILPLIMSGSLIHAILAVAGQTDASGTRSFVHHPAPRHSDLSFVQSLLRSRLLLPRTSSPSLDGRRLLSWSLAVLQL